MKIVIEIKDEYLSISKYFLFGISILAGISYVYFVPGYGLTGSNQLFLLLASIFGIYMAVNLGANDVANNMGPAVGSKAISLLGAILLAVIFEASGAILAGGDVVGTIKGGIIDMSLINDITFFGTHISASTISISIMLGTLLGAALWINIATFFKAPVSATHAIIGGLIGAGIAAANGLGIVMWSKVGMIAVAWVVAIIMGGAIAVIILISIQKTILKQKERGEAAKHRVPIYVGLMSSIFSIYLLLKGLKPLLKSSESLSHIITPASATFLGIEFGILVYLLLIIYYKKKKNSYFRDKKKFVNSLFNIPLVFAVSLLSFAHGSNDVANAIGPIASIYDTVTSGSFTAGNVGIPMWIMLLGAFSLSGGLAIFGARLIKSVGTSITKLNQIRAFCIALSAAITVMIASALSLPVSSTQIAIGAIFGIGFYRAWEKRNSKKDKEYIDKKMAISIVKSWILTLPIAGVISAITYYFIIYVTTLG